MKKITEREKRKRGLKRGTPQTADFFFFLRKCFFQKKKTKQLRPKKKILSTREKKKKKTWNFWKKETRKKKMNTWNTWQGKMKKCEENLQNLRSVLRFLSSHAKSVTISRICRCCCNFFRGNPRRSSWFYFGMCVFLKKFNNQLWRVTVFLKKSDNFYWTYHKNTHFATKNVFAEDSSQECDNPCCQTMRSWYWYER